MRSHPRCEVFVVLFHELDGRGPGVGDGVQQVERRMLLCASERACPCAPGTRFFRDAAFGVFEHDDDRHTLAIRELRGGSEFA